MKTDAFVLIYQVPDAHRQIHLANQLRALGGLVVHIAQDCGEYFVLIRARSVTSAIELHELVLTFDSEADLVDSHDASPETVETFVPGHWTDSVEGLSAQS